MKYYKYNGSHWSTAYAVDDSSPEIRVIELRYHGLGEDAELETVFAYKNTPAGGSYDILAASTIHTYTSITKKEWQDYERTAREFIKQLGGV